MGRFDRRLEGEKKLKGVKRKVFGSLLEGVNVYSWCLQFEPTEVSSASEKSQNMAILSRLEREPATKKANGGSEVLNARKAVRFASKGRGSAALAKESDGAKRGKRR